MTKFNLRDSRHAFKEPAVPGFIKAALLLLPAALLFACSSAPTGNAPGVAGGQSLTPGITNYPMAYVKQPVLKPNTNKKDKAATPADISADDLITSITGSDLYVRETASASSPEVNVTFPLTNGMGAVRDLDVSPDGTKVVFSLRLPLDPNLKNTDPKQPNWKIYQYDAAAKTVTQLTNDSVTSGHDVGAHYLPDGRIVFASTRQVATQAILLDEGRPQYQAVTSDQQQAIFLLHVMNGDGSDMHQITFNTNHDFAPSVLANGQILFSRWEVTNGQDQISLYVTNPDGTGLQLYYGANSHATGANMAGTNNNVIQFLGARQRADGKLLAIVRPMLGTQLGGDIALIDAANFVEINQTSTPAAAAPSGSGPPAVGQTEATTLGVTTDANMPSAGGRFYSLYPLYDGTNRMLVSWAPCLIQTTADTTEVCNNTNTAGPNVVQAPPQYTIWIYDFSAGTLSPLLSAEQGMEIVETVVLQARKPLPAYIPDFNPTTPAQEAMVNNQVGILNISSVYDYDGVDTAKPNIAAQANPSQASFYIRPARFVRLEKAVEIPPKTVRKLDQKDFGPAGMGMREILGYAPVQPDGSVQLQVPADVPFVIDVLDGNGRRISAQHTSWMQVMPGETKTCNGCHTAGNLQTPSHGRSGLTAAVNKGAPTTGEAFPGTNSALFANAGETMAQTLERISCETGSPLPGLPAPYTQPCSQILATDVVYAPIWTDTVATPQPDVALDYPYGGTTGIPSAPPVNGSCAPWSAQCRITIHYANPASNPTQLFIQNLWNDSSRTATVNAVANTPVTCTLCHNPLSAQNKVQVPAGQLDLTGGASSGASGDNDVTHVQSYEDVLFSHDELTLNMGVLQDLLVTDPGPPPTQVPVMLAAPMAAGASASSTAFLRMFDGSFKDPVLDHTGFLTIGEMRLISEWLDIGGQYYNDPFVAPAAAN